MKEIVATLIEKYGSQVNVAIVLGVSDRTVRNYVRFPQKIPLHMQNHMRVLTGREDQIITKASEFGSCPAVAPPTETACEARP